MNRAYYYEYYTLERNHWWFKVREKIIEDAIKNYISPSADLRILNIGAATGRSSEMLSQFGEVTSIEYDEECCVLAVQMTGLNIMPGSILDLPFPENHFDLVCAFDVIEHVEDDGKGVSEMVRVCKKNGLVFITVPAFQGLWSHHDVVNHHFRRYKMKQIYSLFKSSTGLVVRSTYFNSLLFLPIYLFRFSSRLMPGKRIAKNAGSDFSVNSNKLVDKLLFNIFSIERLLLRKVAFPAGVSILFSWKKQ